MKLVLGVLDIVFFRGSA